MTEETKEPTQEELDAQAAADAAAAAAGQPTQEEQDAAAAAAAAQAAAGGATTKGKGAGKTKAKAAAEAGEWPKFLKSLTRFNYTDPETKISFSPNVPVRIDAAPEEGSWLDCQMKANYIGGA